VRRLRGGIVVLAFRLAAGWRVSLVTMAVLNAIRNFAHQSNDERAAGKPELFGFIRRERLSGWP